MEEEAKKTKISLPAISADSGLQHYLREINNIPSLSQEEEFLLAKKYLEDHDVKAAHKLVASHLKLVAKIAMKFRNYGLPTNELISEGNLGLMHAVKKYNPDLGYRLSTYAMWWIKAAIQDYVLKSWSLVKIGTTAAQKKLFFSLGKIKNKIRNINSREITEKDYDQISSELGVTKSEVLEMNQRLSGSDLSLNNPSGDDENSSELIEYIPETRPSQEVMLIKNEDHTHRKKMLSDALATLNERELVIILERKLSENPTTLDDLSKRLNVSKERVRQIENKVFDKMQKFVLEAASR
jgi:RNA polymerase sigma-32 factor